MPYIKFDNVNKIYTIQKKENKILKKINLEIEKGDLVVITGSSNSGKTTLLNILSCDDLNYDGEIFFDDICIKDYNKKSIKKFRKNNIAYLSQDYNLIENLTLKENILLVTKTYKNTLLTDFVIKKLGLTKKANYFPYQLSSNDKQKTKIAMESAKNKDILLLDEPFIGLDEKNINQVLKYIQAISKKERTTIIIATNNILIKDIANKVITLEKGLVKNTGGTK